ncbi:MAG: response regulator [Bacteroidota bacterium]
MMKKPLLVIIDDEPDNLDLLRYNFARRGYEVKTFIEVEKAWEFIKHTQPDMILCEGNHPGTEGLNLYEMMKQDTTLSQIPVVILSYHSEKIHISKALRDGAIDYIIKPVKAYELVNRIDHLLYQHLMIPGGSGDGGLREGTPTP